MAVTLHTGKKINNNEFKEIGYFLLSLNTTKVLLGQFSPRFPWKKR